MKKEKRIERLGSTLLLVLALAMNVFLVGIGATGRFLTGEGWCFSEGRLLQVLEKAILAGLYRQ